MAHHYIRLNGFEDCATLQCIACKGTFIAFDDNESPYEYCPRCGVKLDGLFNKKNPRWDIDRYDNSPYPKNEFYYVLERKDKNGNSPYSKGWHLITHCPVNTLGLQSKWGPISSSVYFIKQFIEYKKQKDKVRLGIWNPQLKKLVVIKEN